MGEHVTRSMDADDPLRQERCAIELADYELNEEIGRGGMGVVYRARDKRLNREVAIKVLQADVSDQTAAISRFRAEAQITAQLQHPGIPAVHELGTLVDGRPFLAMKLVKGCTLQQLLRARTDPSEERGRFVAVFEQVCQAVGYAHAHGVIHRDLKPSNVMVGAFGEVQVMDWGLAKRLGDTGSVRLTEDKDDLLATTVAHVTQIDTPGRAELVTRTGSVLGTPAYMAPEQAGGEIHKLDARSDVFALGAMLCQILIGRPPYRGPTAHDIRLQAVRGEVAEAFAELDICGAEPDLVALCKRCLAFRQEDRPPDAAGVAEEVSRIRRESESRARRAELERAEAWVREHEQAKRRRVWFALAVSLAVGMVASSLLALWAIHARRDALTARHEAEMAEQREAQRADAEARARQDEQRARQEAQRRLTQIERGVELLAGVLSHINPREEEQGGEPLYVQLRKRAEEAADQLDAQAVADALAEARLQTILGNTLRELGNLTKAVQVLEKAVSTRTALLGPDHPDTLSSQHDLGIAYRIAGRFDQAMPLLETTLKARELYLGLDHPDTLRTRSGLATAYADAGQLDKAIPLMEATVKTSEATLGRDHRETLRTRNNLAMMYQEAGQLEKAIALLEDTLARQETHLGADHLDTITTRNNVALAYHNAGQAKKAIPLYEAVLRTQEAKLGMDHPNTLRTRNNLAGAYKDTGQLDKAVPLYEATLKAFETKLGGDHPSTLTIRSNLAVAYQDAGQLDKAIPLFEATLQGREAKLGADHPATIRTRQNLAVAYQEAGQSDRALLLFETALDAQQRLLGPNHPDTLRTQSYLARAYQEMGQVEKALALHEQAAAGMENIQFRHGYATRILPNTINAYERAGQLGEAERWRRKWSAAVKERAGADSDEYASELVGLAGNLLGQHQATEAEEVLRECLTIRQKNQPDAWTTFHTKSMLGEALVKQKKFTDAEPLLLDGYVGMKARIDITSPTEKRRLIEALDRLIQLYDEWNNAQEAAKWRQERQAMAGEQP